jgi:alkylation response protein AidB-like acyl-CoA dehydrogenase
MSGTVLERHGTLPQKERWLRPMADGRVKFAFAITEPDAGTNTHNLRTELRASADGGYVLNGQKTYVSGVEDADAMIVASRFRLPNGELGKHCLCIMETSASGYSHRPIKMPYLAAETQQTLFFDNVRIPPEGLLGGEQNGLRMLFDALNPERIVAAAVATGTGLRALDKAVAYAKVRNVWGQPIGAHQAVAHPLAKSKVELELARLMTQKAAALWDAGIDDAGESANTAKYAAAEAAVHAVDAAIQTHGGNGLAQEYGVSDLWWLARLFRIAPLNSEMVLNHIAQHGLGLPKSY